MHSAFVREGNNDGVRHKPQPDQLNEIVILGRVRMPWPAEIGIHDAPTCILNSLELLDYCLGVLSFPDTPYAKGIEHRERSNFHERHHTLREQAAHVQLSLLRMDDSTDQDAVPCVNTPKYA
jgi:hypothetical protein